MSEKIVVIVQSSYIPWKGFFEMAARADELVLYDDMQYTVRDWRNRNRIKTPNGLHWLSIPVVVKGKRYQCIKDTQVVDSSWADKHWKTIRFNYGKAPFFEQYASWLEDLYTRAKQETHLSRINRLFIQAICEKLEIDTAITFSDRYELVAGKTEKLLHICEQAGATRYLSGPSAKDYMDATLFENKGIGLEFMEYDYPEYEQLYPPFEHAVTVLDPLMQLGPESKAAMNL